MRVAKVLFYTKDSDKCINDACNSAFGVGSLLPVDGFIRISLLCRAKVTASSQYNRTRVVYSYIAIVFMRLVISHRLASVLSLLAKRVSVDD